MSRHSLPLLALLSVVAGWSCKKELRPGHCFSEKDCAPGQACDSIGVCVSADDGGAGGGLAGAGQGGAGQGGGQAGRGGGGGMGMGGAGGGSTPGMDARPPDAFVCRGNDDCSGATAVCDMSTGKCVQCLNAGQCPTAAAPVCSAAKTCTGCSLDDHCSGRADGLKACDNTSGSCVRCTQAQHCGGATPVCDNAAPQRCVECVSASQCPSTAPVCGAARTCGKCSMDGQCSGRPDGLKACDTTAGACVLCTKNSDCGGGTPFCDTAAHRCVQCLDSSACSGTAPICGADRKCAKCGDSNQCMALGDAARKFCLAGTGACVQCLDSDACSGTSPFCSSNACVTCGGDDGKCVGAKAEPGVCMDDGHCATQAEVIYVKDTGASCAGADGSLSKPYCDPALAIPGLTDTRRVMVLRGDLGRVPIDTAVTSPVLLVGQQNATVTPVNRTGIEVTRGTVKARDLTITGGISSTGQGARVSGSSAKLELFRVTVRDNRGVGVQAESGGGLVLKRCQVLTNAGGGIKTDAASFDVTNSLIAGNSSGALVGGVTLGAAPSSGPTRFLNNTIADNKKVGMSCAPGANYAIAGSILYNNDGLDVNGDCAVTSCCSGNPLLTSTYRLMSGSPCLDQLAPAMSVPDDIDGKARPYNGKSDCGASEWSP